MTATGSPARESTRVIVFDPSGRLLLLNTSDLCDPPLEWWELPGGGIEPGEQPEDAARRELREETGIGVPTVGTAVAQVRERGCFAGERFEQIETVFAVFLDSLPTIAPAFVGSVEARAHVGHRWWYLRDAVASGLRLYPTRLPELAAPLTRRFVDSSSGLRGLGAHARRGSPG